jgi:hypothetical protein
LAVEAGLGLAEAADWGSVAVAGLGSEEAAADWGSAEEVERDSGASAGDSADSAEAAGILVEE